MKVFNSIDEFNNWMVRVTNKLRNAKEPITDYFKDYYLGIVRKRFLFEEGPKGKWQDLKASTQKIRKSLGYPPAHPILKRTGKLMRSVTSPRAIRVSDKEGELSTNVKYAHLHQFGDDLIPPRPFLYTKKHDLDVLAETFVNWIQNVMNRTL